MTLKLSHINYSSLNARQKENFNFQKVSAVLADYGFVTIRLSDDWQGADFIAQHVDGETFIKVQLKGRLTFEKKYQGKDLYVAFHSNGSWYLFPHDEVWNVSCQKLILGKRAHGKNVVATLSLDLANKQRNYWKHTEFMKRSSLLTRRPSRRGRPRGWP